MRERDARRREKSPTRRGPEVARFEHELAFSGTHRRSIHFRIMTERPLANFDLETAIALRWALRDILGNRLKLSPLRDDHLRTLIELGLVEMRDDTPVVTPAGLAALD